MNLRTVNILLVDDHHLILEGYKNVISNFEIENTEIILSETNTLDGAWEIVHSKTIDIVFLDINFPVNGDSKFLSGEDLGIIIKKELPQVKIVILTVLQDKFRLENILTNIRPSGFLFKGETTSKELLFCIQLILNNQQFYGPRIAKILFTGLTSDIYLDDLDRKMLYQLSLGTKTKDLTEHVNLSLRAVENRKRRLKEIFGVSGKGNKALLEKARESGYI